MQFSVTFRHMDATEALKNYAKERFERIKKYFPDPIACHVVLSTERYNHRVDVNLQLHNGFKIAGHEITENMYS
jgi:putative sigma-54 modulation protein